MCHRDDQGFATERVAYTPQRLSNLNDKRIEHVLQENGCWGLTRGRRILQWGSSVIHARVWGAGCALFSPRGKERMKPEVGQRVAARFLSAPPEVNALAGRSSCCGLAHLGMAPEAGATGSHHSRHPSSARSDEEGA